MIKSALLSLFILGFGFSLLAAEPTVIGYEMTSIVNSGQHFGEGIAVSSGMLYRMLDKIAIEFSLDNPSTPTYSRHKSFSGSGRNIVPSQDGSRLYVTIDDRMEVWDRVTLSTLGVITAPYGIFDLEISPDEHYAYLLMQTDYPTKTWRTVYDIQYPSTMTMVGGEDIGCPDDATSIKIHPSGLWAAMGLESGTPNSFRSIGLSTPSAPYDASGVVAAVSEPRDVFLVHQTSMVYAGSWFGKTNGIIAMDYSDWDDPVFVGNLALSNPGLSTYCPETGFCFIGHDTMLYGPDTGTYTAGDIVTLVDVRDPAHMVKIDDRNENVLTNITAITGTVINGIHYVYLGGRHFDNSIITLKLYKGLDIDNNPAQLPRRSVFELKKWIPPQTGLAVFNTNTNSPCVSTGTLTAGAVGCAAFAVAP